MRCILDPLPEGDFIVRIEIYINNVPLFVRHLIRYAGSSEQSDKTGLEADRTIPNKSGAGFY